MRFACTQENLLQGLNTVGHITGKNINLPVLGNVLLKTENGGLKLSTTNLEIAINCLVRGKNEAEGEYSVPAKLLTDYISLLPAGKVELELTEDGLEIRSNDKETILKGLPASEFPLLPKLTKDEGYLMQAADVKRALGQVTFAASVSESRPELSGVVCFFQIVENHPELTVVATDSYRLAERRLKLTKGQPRESVAIVPARSMLEIARIISGYKDEISGTSDVGWSFTDNQLVVSFGNVELVTRLIEGSFPPYKEIIPSAFKTEALISRSEVQKAVRAASLFSRQGLFDVAFDFRPEEGSCIISSADQGTGKTKTVIKCKIEGVANKITLNFRYVTDGLAAIQSENIKLTMIDENNPVLILPEGQTENYRYLVMPIRQ
ncbi:MAG: DNA polymerase III subunit beta [Patescibacteria group bacterium]